MKILVITQKVDEDDAVLGFFTSWLKALAGRADEVKVIALAKGNYHLPANVEVVSLKKENGASKVRQAANFYFNALRFLPEVDGVFVHMAPEYVRALYPLNIFFRKPVIMWYAHIQVGKVANWSIDHVDYILTPSKESFVLNSPKVVSTGHGIDVETFSPLDRKPNADVLCLSRISKVKRIETIIEAAMILKNKGFDLSFNIYGEPARPEDGKYLEELKDKVRNYGLTKEIVWKGSVSNRMAPEVYAMHRIFVRLQGGGGFGKTELEAMAMGVPAITPTPVYQKDLENFASDLYFEEDNASELAEKIKDVLSWNKAKREKYAKLSRKIVCEKHNVENVANKIVELIEKCAA